MISSLPSQYRQFNCILFLLVYKYSGAGGKHEIFTSNLLSFALFELKIRKSLSSRNIYENPAVQQIAVVALEVAAPPAWSHLLSPDSRQTD